MVFFPVTASEYSRNNNATPFGDAWLIPSAAGRLTCQPASRNAAAKSSAYRAKSAQDISCVISIERGPIARKLATRVDELSSTSRRGCNAAMEVSKASNLAFA